jgi:hypothetical protein
MGVADTSAHVCAGEIIVIFHKGFDRRKYNTCKKHRIRALYFAKLHDLCCVTDLEPHVYAIDWNRV